MESLRQYVISVTGTALVCGIVTGMVKKNTAGELIRMLCGLVLAVAVLYPLAGFRMENAALDLFPSLGEGESMAAQGKKITRDAVGDIIKSETEAYILDKAAALGVELTAEVLLGEDEIPVPVGVILSGAASPYARSQLTNVIEKDLGIPKEKQVWI